jgi:hypothetical protein
VKKCPSLNCPAPIRNGAMLCRDCMTRVPPLLMRELKDAFKKIGGNDPMECAKIFSKLSHQERADRLKNYHRLVRAVVESTFERKAIRGSRS